MGSVRIMVPRVRGGAAAQVIRPRPSPPASCNSCTSTSLSPGPPSSSPPPLPQLWPDDDNERAAHPLTLPCSPNPICSSGFRHPDDQDSEEALASKLVRFSASDIDADSDAEEALLTDFLTVPQGDAPLEARVGGGNEWLPNALQVWKTSCGRVEGGMSCVLGREHGGTIRAFTPPLPFFTLPPLVQARLDELCSAADRNDMLVHVFQFAPLRPGETLQAHVRRQCMHGQQPSLGPTLQVRGCAGGGRVCRGFFHTCAAAVHAWPSAQPELALPVCVWEWGGSTARYNQLVSVLFL